MQLLYIDSDPSAARQLHSEFLSYKGMQWDLVHCRDSAAAEKTIRNYEVQAVLYRSSANFSSVCCETEPLLKLEGAPPVVSVLDQLTAPEHLRLLETGVHDSLIRSQVSGHAILRRLRMADLRQAVWNKTTKHLDWSAWIQSLTNAESTENSANSSLTDFKITGRFPFQARIAHVCPPGKSVFDDPLQGSRSELSGDLQMEFLSYPNLTALLEAFADRPQEFDAVLIESAVFEQEHRKTIANLDPFLWQKPSLILTMDRSDSAALSYLEQGYADCLTTEHVSVEQIQDTLRKAIVRYRRNVLEAVSQHQVGPSVSDRRNLVRQGSQRRKDVRFLFQHPVVAIPMLPNGAPDKAAMCPAESLDISLGGIGIQIPPQQQLPSRNWILGIDQGSGGFRYINAYLRRFKENETHAHLGLVFQSHEHDFLHPDYLTPAIQSESKRFACRTADEVLQAWTELGVLQHRLLYRAKVCPECRAASVFGTGCNQCGSIHVHHDDLIHHFACAYVDQADHFQVNGQIHCPKCLCQHLVVGADFEIIRSQYTCQDCGHKGSDPTQVGQCLSCQVKFPIDMAHELDVMGYHVERVDVLALVDAAR